VEKRSFWIAVSALVVALIAAAVGVVALTGDDGSSNGPTTVSVASTASVGTAPDEAVVTVEVLAEDPQSSAAYEKGQADTDAVLTAVEGAGVSRDDIETTDVGLQRVVRDRKTPQEHTVYVARNRLSITVTNLDTVGDVVSAAVEGGADRIDGVRFQVSDQAVARNEAIAEAVRGARAKAESAAEAAGANLGGVVRIEEGNVSTPSFDAVGYARGFTLQAAPSIVAPQELQTKVTVTVVWSLEG
jgi:uncharacterized protein YggE